MSSQLKNNTLAGQHGRWGENIAAEFLRHGGYVIIESNVHPVEKDKRLEIDIVAWDSKTETLVFIEVKQHATLSQYARRMQSVDRDKRRNLRRACRSWLRINRWHGSFRFDVIEIYGVPEGGSPIIDHIDHVELFSKPGRFVKWN